MSEPQLFWFELASGDPAHLEALALTSGVARATPDEVNAISTEVYHSVEVTDAEPRDADQPCLAAADAA